MANADVTDARRTAIRGTLIAVALAAASGILLVAWPCFYVGETAILSPGGVPRSERVCATLIGENGLWVAWLLAIPVALAVLGWTGAVLDRRGLIWAAGFASLGFSIVAMWSIGVFSLPSAITLLVTAGVARRRSGRGLTTAPAAPD
jgi:hypothetical protein